MPRIEYSVTITRPISEVFNYVADFNKHPKWQPDVVDVRQSENKLRVGVMVTEVRRLRALFYQLDLNADIIDYQINKRIEYKGTTGFFPITGSYSFESYGLQTKVTEVADIRMWGPHRLLSGFVSGAMRRRMEKTWNNLKQLLESGGAR